MGTRRPYLDPVIRYSLSLCTLVLRPAPLLWFLVALPSGFSLFFVSALGSALLHFFFYVHAALLKINYLFIY
jgi:hypothetical protein